MTVVINANTCHRKQYIAIHLKGTMTQHCMLNHFVFDVEGFMDSCDTHWRFTAFVTAFMFITFHSALLFLSYGSNAMSNSLYNHL